jgi:hypothetical protein
MRQATVKPYESFAFTLEELTRLEQSITNLTDTRDLPGCSKGLADKFQRPRHV